MEKPNSSGLARTKSKQLVETVAAKLKSPPPGEATSTVEGGSTLLRKSSRRMMRASPGRGSGSVGKNTHIRKSRSAQMKLDMDEMSSGATLSCASSTNLGFSFPFTSFTVPVDNIADTKPFSDDDDLPSRNQRTMTLDTLPLAASDLHIMDRSRRNSTLICAPVMVESVDQMLVQMGKAKEVGANLVEIWEGGQYKGDDKQRQDALRVAMELGADFIDVELKVTDEFYNSIKGKKPVKVADEFYNSKTHEKHEKHS
ncbi:hypothetical protein ACFX11_041278 [Malus domestica]